MAMATSWSKLAQDVLALRTEGDSVDQGRTPVEAATHPIGERLRLALAARGMKAGDVDRAMGKAYGAVATILQRQSTPRRETAEAIAATLRIRIEWLLHGEGDMDAAVKTGQEQVRLGGCGVFEQNPDAFVGEATGVT